MLALGRFGAVGLAPFGIDQADPRDLTVTAWAFTRLRELTPLLLEARERSAVTGFVLDDRAPTYRWVFAGVAYIAAFGREMNAGDIAYGLLVVLPGGRLLAVGEGFAVTARDVGTGAPLYVRDAEEGRVVDGGWRRVRRLNGDETRSGESLVLPLVLRSLDTPSFGDQRSTGVRQATFAPSRDYVLALARRS